VIAVPVQALWFLHGLDFAEKLGLEAVVIAIALGVPAIDIAVQHARDLEAVATRLEALATAVPTRGIGVFPDYLSEVVGLVKRADKSIKILCDTPAHGAFSNPTVFHQYCKELRHKIVDGRVLIECAFLDEAGRQKMHRAQIADSSDNWEKWQEANQENCAAFDVLAASFGVTAPSSGTRADDPISTWAATPDMYVASAMGINERVLEAIRGAQVSIEELTFTNPLREGPGVYFWIRDRFEEAVFIIVPVRGLGVKQLAGFHTKDRVLIEALYTVYDNRKNA